MSQSQGKDIESLVLENIKNVIGDANDIENIMSYSALAKSKLLRSKLIFASGNINQNISTNSLINLSTAIELMHTYSLIHDDLPAMDNDQIRRGQPTSHIKFGEANAILAGDALQALAYEVITSDADLSNAHKVKAINNLSSACGKSGMVYGQYLDVKNEGVLLDIDELIKIHSLKTGKLIESSIIIPLLNLDNQKCLEDFEKISTHYGLAFQIVDDLLDIGDSEIGKDKNSDLKNNKSSFATLMKYNEAYEHASSLINGAYEYLNKYQNTLQLIELGEFILTRKS